MALSRKEKDKRSEHALTPIPDAKPKQKEFFFLDVKTNKEGDFQDVKIKLLELRDLLRNFGFIRYDIEKDFIYSKLQDKVIEEVTANQIIDSFEEYLSSLPAKIDVGRGVEVPKAVLLNKVFNGIGTYFSDKILARLRPTEQITINADKHDTAYFYYKNGYVLVTKSGYSFHPFKDLEGYVWKNQILKRDFKKLDLGEFVSDPKNLKSQWGVFADFLWKVSGQDADRFFSLCTITGYNLHNNTEGKCKATILTDSLISDRSEGRTGKTLYGKAIGKMVNCSDEKKVYCEISGKDFDPMYKHKYQDAGLDTKIIHLNDVTDYFNFSVLYNDITEGIAINRKGETSLRIKPKMILSTNRTIRIEGASDRDRCIEFEFANYFSDKLSPEQEYGHWFFRDWNDDEWALFDNFMILCTMMYLDNNIIKPKSINLERRKLIDYTNSEFIEWMDDLFKTNQIKPGDWNDVKFLFDEITKAYPDFLKDKNHTQKRFNKWLQNYANGTNTLENFSKDRHYKKRMNGYDFMFELKQEKQ